MPGKPRAEEIDQPAPMPSAAALRSQDAQSGSSATSSSSVIVGLGIGTLVAALAATWLFSRSRQPVLDERTRDRLRPRGARHDAPSAADIRID